MTSGPATGSIELVTVGRSIRIEVALTQPAPAEPPFMGAPTFVVECIGIRRNVSMSAAAGSEVNLASVTL